MVTSGRGCDILRRSLGETSGGIVLTHRENSMNLVHRVKFLQKSHLTQSILCPLESPRCRFPNYSWSKRLSPHHGFQEEGRGTILPLLWVHVCVCVYSQPINSSPWTTHHIDLKENKHGGLHSERPTKYPATCSCPTALSVVLSEDHIFSSPPKTSGLQFIFENMVSYRKYRDRAWDRR